MSGKPHHKRALVFTTLLLLLGSVPGAIFYEAPLPRNGIGANIVFLIRGERIVPLSLMVSVAILVLSYFVARWMLARFSSAAIAGAATGASYSLVGFLTGIPNMISFAEKRGLGPEIFFNALPGLATGIGYYGFGLALVALITAWYAPRSYTRTLNRHSA